MAFLKIIFFVICLAFHRTKSFTEIESAIVSLFQNYALSNESLDRLKNAKVEELPVFLRDIVDETVYGEHMCCRNRPVSLITKTRSAKRVTVEKEEVKIGSNDCGLLGTGTCNTYGYIYHEVITYVTESFQDIDYLDCPDRHVVCCNYYIMVSQKCIYLDDLHVVAQKIIG